MASILLSIKSEYVDKILSGEKKYEFRKHRPKQSIEKIVIYETSPKKRIVGLADVVGIISDTPERLWGKTCKNGGISKDAFMEYYGGAKEAYAFELGKITLPKKSFELSQLGISQPPQSYVYLNDEQMKMVMEF